MPTAYQMSPSQVLQTSQATNTDQVAMDDSQLAVPIEDAAEQAATTLMMLKSSEEGWSSDKNESVASNGVGEGVASNSVTEISSQTVEVDSRSASSRLSGYESDVESVGAESGDKHVSKARLLSAQEIAEISCSNAYNPDNDGRFPILY